jgi:cytochrome oxidase Cu insertion factor (SCO1/SenC/PrrC family)
MKTMIKKFAALAAALLMTVSLAACGQSSPADSSGSTSTAGTSTAGTSTPGTFPSFTATDMNGNQVTDQTFKDHPVTVLNLWFTGCTGCVQEMPNLEKISEMLKEKGGQMIGICTDPADTQTKKEAQDILTKNGVTYTNLFVDSSSDAQKYLDSVMAFPTTLLVDRGGNIVGDPVVGSIDTQEQIDDFMKRVDDIVAKDGGNK